MCKFPDCHKIRWLFSNVFKNKLIIWMSIIVFIVLITMFRLVHFPPFLRCMSYLVIFLTESFVATPITSLSYTWSFIGIKTILPWKNTLSICNICPCSQKGYWLVWKNSVKNFCSRYRKTSPYIIDLHTMFSTGLLLFFSSIYSVKQNLAECFGAPTVPQFPSLIVFHTQ